MDKLGFDLDDGSCAGPGETKVSNIQEARNLSIQRCIQSLIHACQCRDANYRLPSCHKMKRVVAHAKVLQDEHETVSIAIELTPRRKPYTTNECVFMTRVGLQLM